MAKKIQGYIKLQVPAGTANPSPPIGPALGQRGVNIMEFYKAYNAATDGPLCVHATRCLAVRATYTTWRRVVDALAPDVSETELTLIRRWCYAPKRHVMDCTEGLHSTLVKAAGCVEIKQ